MSNIDKQALRADAMEATGGSWVRESGEGWEAICCDDDQGNAGFIIAEFQGENATANRKFVQSANPATVLALLDELERKQQYIKSRDQENEDIALTVGRMRVELEAAEKRIAELELREVVLPQCYSMLHRVDFDEPYHTEMVYRQHQVLEALHNAGINVTEAGKGEAS
ncbi:ead/Ea22-like family protein [Escherichia coli]|jgi:hypothetical protein|uniref:ead/Ea22-like family protein n=1 Tax=Escherichia coli TaxID=562 RepID=UPI0030C6FCEF